MITDNFIVRWFIETEGNKMFTKLFAAVQGYKTYIIAVMGIFVALIGHFWGPISIGTGPNALQIPHMDWNSVWDIIWNGGLIAALRHGVTTTQNS